MRVLVDTNVLLRAAEVNSMYATMALGAVDSLQSQKYELCIVPQVLYEIWVVATRSPETNGLAKTSEQAAKLIHDLRARFPLYPDPHGLVDTWLDLVVKHQVQGKPAHDARLIAAMKLNSIDALLTFNILDFTRYQGVRIVSPADVLGIAG